MTSRLKRHRYLISRRIVQLAILFLFVAGNYLGWRLLWGNYSSASLLDTIPLSDPYAALQILVSGFILATDVLVGGLVVLVFYALLGGRTFCAWVCPLNLVSDLALWLKRKIKWQNQWQWNINKRARYYILGLSLVLSAILAVPAFEMVSPISIFHRAVIFGMGGAWVVILAFFLFEMISKNGWCSHLCPLGTFYALVGRYGFLKVYHREDNCTRCNLCFGVCPEKQVLAIVTVSSGYILSGECTNCGKCIEVCEDTALHFALNYMRTKNLEK